MDGSNNYNKIKSNVIRTFFNLLYSICNEKLRISQNLFLILQEIITRLEIMAELSNRLNRLAPSATLAMSQKSGEMKAQGVDVINLSVGEPDFNTPDHIKEAAKKAIDENFSRYSPVPGYMDLRKAIVAKLKNENNLDYTPAEILVSNGARKNLSVSERLSGPASAVPIAEIKL